MSRNSPVILDISSDEEGDFGNGNGNYRGGGSGYGDRDDHEWLSGILGEVDRNQDDDDSDDDVVVVSEVYPNPRRSRVQASNRSERIVANNTDDDGDDCDDDEDEDEDPDGHGDGDDGDCVILDCEPRESEMVENSGADDVDDTDDVEIVGEKGEVACRDFPHPRHHCAKFPFASTPHQVHCGQCHCYVCDSIAPCRYWGTGQSNFDHCNANEKMVLWVTARKTKLMQNQGSVSSNVTPPKIKKSARSVRDPRLNPSLRLDAKYPNLITEVSQVISPPTFKRSGIVGDSVPNNRKNDPRIPFFNSSHSSNQQNSGPATSSANSAFSSEELTDLLRKTASKYLPHVASQPNLGVALEDRVLPHPDTVFEPNGPVPSLSPYSQPSDFFNNFGNQTLTQSSVASQPNGPLPSQGPYSQPSDFFNNFNNQTLSQSPIASQPNLGVGLENRVLPPQPEVFYPNGGPYSQPSVSFNNFGNQALSQSQVDYQPNFGVGIENWVPQPDQIFQPNGALPFQSPYSQPPHFFNNFGHQTLPQSKTSSSHHSSGNTFENQFHIPQEYRIPAPVSSHNWNASYVIPENPQITTEISQIPDLEPADYSQYHSVTKEKNERNTAPNLKIHLKSVAPRNKSSAVDDVRSRFTGSSDPDPLDFQFDNCSFDFDDESSPGDSKFPLSPGSSIFSPEPASMNAGTHFGF